MFKRILSVALIVLALVPFTFAQEPELDLTYPVSFRELQEQEIIDYDNQNPLERVNRAEFVKIVVKSQLDFEPIDTDCFPDIENEWYEPYVCYAKNIGIVNGYSDGNFKPSRTINFAEASKVLSLAYDLELGEGEDYWFQKYIESLEKVNAIPVTLGNTYNKIDKEHLVEIVWRLMYEKTYMPSQTFEELHERDRLINFMTDFICGPIKDFIETEGEVKYLNPNLFPETEIFKKELNEIAQEHQFESFEDASDKTLEYKDHELGRLLYNQVKKECDLDLFELL